MLFTTNRSRFASGSSASRSPATTGAARRSSCGPQGRQRVPGRSVPADPLPVPGRLHVDLALRGGGRRAGVVRVLKDLDDDVIGLDVVLVEDIIDTGLTLSYLLAALRAREPASLEVCTLLDRSARRIRRSTSAIAGSTARTCSSSGTAWTWRALPEPALHPGAGPRARAGRRPGRAGPVTVGEPPQGDAGTVGAAG